MVNRRHIRIKVMQSIYALHQKNSDDMVKEEKFLLHSLDAMQDLYLLMITSLIEIQKKEEEFLSISSKKYLATEQDRRPNRKFVNNSFFKLLMENSSISEAKTKRKINNWEHNDDYVLLLLKDVKGSGIYEEYMKNNVNTFEEDRKFLIDIFTEVVVPNEKLYDYLQDYKLTWLDDLPLINTLIIKQIRSIKSETDKFMVPEVYKNEEDKTFAIELFRKTLINENEYAKEYKDKTPNWDTDRIAEIDTIILKMAICEFLQYPFIPTKVTINEYLEIAKEYSTPKSSFFLNGVMDNLVKEFTENQRMNKIGRGLI